MSVCIRQASMNALVRTACRRVFQKSSCSARSELRVEDPTHPSTSFLPKAWVRTDEWYNFRTNPRDVAHVLLVLDESTYQGGEMGADHPYTWCRGFSGGRTGLQPAAIRRKAIPSLYLRSIFLAAYNGRPELRREIADKHQSETNFKGNCINKAWLTRHETLRSYALYAGKFPQRV